MLSASARLSSLRLRTGSRSPWRSSSESGVLLSSSSSGSFVVILTPEATSFDQLLRELVFHLPSRAGCLVLQPHVLLDGCDLRMSKPAGALPDHCGQRTSRYQQVDQVAAEGISGAAQGSPL